VTGVGGAALERAANSNASTGRAAITAVPSRCRAGVMVATCRIGLTIIPQWSAARWGYVFRAGRPETVS
jgi:hypothetical protein